jgi:parallel beta-helix repeat protein
MTVSTFKRLSLIILFVFLIANIVNARLLFPSVIVDSSIIRVPRDYPTIQAAVDAAFSGDTILVAAGLYSENVLVNKPVKIFGEDRDNTIVEGAGDFSYTVLVMADHVEIGGITARNGQAGIFLNHSSLSYIHDNIVTSNTYLGGVVLWYSNENTIANNTALGNGGGTPSLQYGVGIGVYYSNRNVISSNTLTSNVAGSLILGNSHHNTIINNTVYKDKSGIMLSSSTWNSIVANNIYSNIESGGIGLSYSSNNTVENNKLNGNWGELHVVILL